MASRNIEEAKKSVKRIQDFDPGVLPREEDLGTGLSFRKAVEPAKQLIGLYNQLGISALDEIPAAQLNQIKKQADADFNKLQQVLDFSLEGQSNPTQTRNNIVNNIENAYQPAFNKLHPFISYSVSRTVDFQRLENEGRSAIQSVRDQANDLTNQLEDTRDEAQEILKEVREIAAEQGVSQQAIYFKEESDSHAKLAETWRTRTLVLAIIIAVYAIISILFHKIPFIQPETTIQSIQLISSKILIFGVLSYVLFLAAKNFLSHKHNSIVNKHRQNALMTFNSLADAAQSEQGKEVILTHAAACIFSPQDTGYSKSKEASSGNGRSIIELMPQAINNAET